MGATEGMGVYLYLYWENRGVLVLGEWGYLY